MTLDANDPNAFVRWHYDKKKNMCMDELYDVKLSNRNIAEWQLKDKGYSSKTTICDSAEPKSIAELKELGVRVSAAKKDQTVLSLGREVA